MYYESSDSLGYLGLCIGWEPSVEFHLKIGRKDHRRNKGSIQSRERDGEESHERGLYDCGLRTRMKTSWFIL